MNGLILVVDIGNSSTVAGLYRAGRVQSLHRLDTKDTKPSSVRRLVARITKGRSLSGAVVSSVVPRVNATWKRALRRGIDGRVIWVSHRLKLGLRLDYPRPKTIGGDRLANACGAVHRYGAPAIVADFGTALTFDVVTKQGTYVGGVIAPGLPLMFEYLAEKTANLPLLSPGPTRHAVGKSTSEAMQLGAQWGYRGMVREILGELLRDSDLRGARLLATGGFARWAVQKIKPRLIVDPTLTLYGLGKIFELNT